MPLDSSSKTPNGHTDPSLWRDHFPIDTEKEAAHSRRQFVGGLSTAGGAIACGQWALNYIHPEQSNPLGEAIQLPPVILPKKLSEIDIHEAIVFHFPDARHPCLLIKLDENRVVAYAQKCTHLACPVVPEPERNRLHCPCHHGAFDLESGKPLAGPPRSALRRIALAIADDGTISATGIIT